MLTAALNDAATTAGAWAAAAAPYALTVLLAALAGGAAWHVRRSRRTAHALTGRARFELVPTNEFDPSEATVGRFAQQLTRPRYAVAGTPARGAAIRLRYTAEDGRMRCYLEGPRAAAAVLAMPGFADVEHRTAATRRTIRPVRFTPPAQKES